MGAIQGRIDAARLAFGRLTQREQVMVLGASAAVVFFLLLVIGLSVSSAIGKAENRVKNKTQALMEILQKQGEYKAKQREQKQMLRELSKLKNVRLVKLVEDAARQAGINKDIGRLQPQEGEPNADGVVESKVELSARGLSIDRLQDFLTRLSRSPGILVINKIKVNKPYRKDTLDVEISITTFKVKT